MIQIDVLLYVYLLIDKAKMEVFMFFDLEQLEKSLASEGKKLPPVNSWHPERVADIDIVIDSQVRWYHEGGLFQRQALVDLFSTILRKEGDEYYLVTPAEKLRISVADVPFLVVSLLDKEGVFYLLCQTGELLELNEKSHWQLREYQGAQIPYVEVRDGLFARVDRHVYYQMVERAIQDEQGRYVLPSGGVYFPLA